MTHPSILFPLAVLAVAAVAPLGAASGAGFLVVANKGDHTVGFIDTESGIQVATVEEGGVTGHELTASPDGRTIYVPIYGNSGVGKPGTDGQTMVVIDAASRKVTGRFDFGKGVRPHCAVFDAKNNLLYVTTELEQAITAIDPASLRVVGKIPTGQAESHMLAITRDGRRGYTANVGPGTVSVLDLAARKLITVIPVSGETQRIALSVDDKLVFTADQKKPQLAVIDTATNKLTTWVALPATGYGTSPTPDGRWLLVAVPATRQVAVVDLKSMKVARTIDVPAAPQEVLVRPDGRVAYVSCDASGKVAAIDTSTWKVERVMDAGKSVDGLAWVAGK
ncbi:MAG: cytochrome D1 domain-containing protein [Bryobacteraceae bacterium]|jgi:DNA-binding beta-propeller fold protein YncE